MASAYGTVFLLYGFLALVPAGLAACGSFLLLDVGCWKPKWMHQSWAPRRRRFFPFRGRPLRFRARGTRRSPRNTRAPPPRDPSPTEYPRDGRGGAATHVDIRAAKVPSSGRAPVRSPRGRRPRVAGAAGRPREVAQAEGRDAYRLLLQEIYSAHPARVRPLLVGSGAIAMQLLVLLTIAQHLCGFRSLRGSHWAYGAASCFPPRRDDARLG